MKHSKEKLGMRIHLTHSTKILCVNLNNKMLDGEGNYLEKTISSNEHIHKQIYFISIFLTKEKLNYYSKYIDNQLIRQIVALE